ncbi:ATP-binding protein [Catenibacterium mitsuokai]|uniref:ATP-binding protein n=1 Tax=Catenibacterium mitsuokai TaxID=100886 RepID=UPI003F8F1CD2
MLQERSFYIHRHENLIIVGAKGSGKSYIACALGVEACNAPLKVMYVRLPDLLAELDFAKVQENYRKRINQYIKCDLLILDEWLLIGTNNAEQQDILEILEKRYRTFQQYSALSLMLQDDTVSLVEVA